MVDINSIWESLIKGLNTEYQNYTFAQAKQEGNLPPYPYCIINCLTPYKRDKDDIRGTITRAAVEGDDTKVQISREEEPQMIFSFNAYSDKQEECLQLLKDTINWLTFSGQQYLQSCGIVVLEVSGMVDKTNWLEVKFQYHWGFDLTIRVGDKQSIQLDTIGSVETTNLNE